MRDERHGGTANESAVTFRWLTAQLNLDRDDGAAPARSVWQDVRTLMLRVSSNGQTIVQNVDWISDFWVARGARPMSSLLGDSVSSAFFGLAPEWAPPAEITDWPSYDAEMIAGLFGGKAKRALGTNLRETLRNATSPDDPIGAVRDAQTWYWEAKAQFDPSALNLPAIQTDHTQFWISAAIGKVLMGLSLTPDIEPDMAAEILIARLRLIATGEYARFDELGDRQLERLYNARFSATGELDVGSLRVGQGIEWRDNWVTLSSDIGAADALKAVQMAARLLRSTGLLAGLSAALSADDQAIKLLAVAVLRRLFLTLQAMAWLEHALHRTWFDVRPKDLCCLALNAVKPDWPRRVVAISHRSQDVKPLLRHAHVWTAGRIAIDANYIPSWETNIGMIWGLFAPTPAIVRVHSPTYRDSVWCRRELEITEFFLRDCDFLTDRWIIDLDETDVGDLDAIVDRWEPGALLRPRRQLPEFPPLTEVCSPQPMPGWEVRMLRAGAALRVIHAAYPGVTADVVNGLALHLQLGGEVTEVPAPTNNPDGWQAYAEIFRELASVAGVPAGTSAIELPSGYEEAARRRDAELLMWIPDMRSGAPALGDVLAALEWLLVEFSQWLDRKGGEFLAINCQRFTREAWETSEEASVLRGLASMRRRLPVPLWIIQSSGQQVEDWPLIGDAPIFTEHVDAQFGWMMEGSFVRRESQRRYPDDSLLILAPSLAEMCLRGTEHDHDDEQLPK